MKYPKFHKVTCAENIHGQIIYDPYRWLEDPYSDKTKDFVEKQNEITFSFFDECKYRKKINEKLTLLWNYPIYGSIIEHGDYFYHFYNSGLQNQNVLYQMKSIHDEPKLFLDPNEWSTDGTISLKFVRFSKDGKFLSYGQCESGHDWINAKFMEVETKKVFPDELTHIKFSDVQWTHDNKGVFYSGFLEQEGVKDGTETTSNVNQKLRYHKMGTSQNEDILCYDILEQPTWMIGSEVTDCGKYLLIYVNKGTDPKVRVYYSDLSAIEYKVTERLELNTLVGDFEAKYDYIINIGTIFYFVTNKNAPMQKVVAVDISDNKLEWKDLISTNDTMLLNWALCTNEKFLVVCLQKDVSDIVSVHCLETGVKLRNIEFPLGSIGSCNAERDSPYVFFKFTSYLEPGVNYCFDLTNGLDAANLDVINTTKIVGLNLDNFISERVFYSSKDGVKIPMFITRRKDVELDGNNPCRLYGYGGFDICIKPSFSISQMFLMQYFGFVSAVANIRGGGEYGENWHNGGRLHMKQNCFDDFIAAASYLIDEKYTSSKLLAIEGGSNGGLLTAVCANQCPELFGCVIAHVGVMDMLRFHKFTIGHAWISDFGDPDKKEDFEYLIKYSPLHNVKAGVQYPACLVLSADHDDRVVPLHTMKYIATLQEVAGLNNEKPLLARFDVKSGHGAGKPTTKRIDEVSDVICFMQLIFNLEWKD